MTIVILTVLIFLAQIGAKVFFDESFGYLSILLSQICVVVIPGLLYFAAKDRKIGDYISVPKKFLFSIPMAIITVISVNILTQYINYPIIKFIKLPAGNGTIYNSTYELIITIILLCVIPAMFEEVLFRGIILEELSDRFSSRRGAIFITAAIFAAVHLDFSNLIPQFILGAILCHITLAEKSVLTAMIAHFANNLFSIILREQFSSYYSSYGILLFLLSVLLTTIGVVYFKKKASRREI